MTSQKEELDALLLEWEEGTLDESGQERVRELLKSKPELRKHFLRQNLLTAALHLQSEVEVPQAASALVTKQTKTPPNRSRPLQLAAVACLVACLLGIRLVYLELRDARPEPRAVTKEPRSRVLQEEATSQGIALITRLVDVEWESDQDRREVGDALTPGPLKMKSGFAQIEFFCGATVVVEGPAELDLKSPTLARVYRGTLRAQVPPAARGFSLEVDDLKVVDLGTEFGLSVSPAGAGVQVFDGEVEVRPNRQATQRLVAGEALQRAAEGDYQKTTTTPDRFLDLTSLESRAHDQQAARYGRWQAWSARLKEDPRLIAYYSFDQKTPWERRLRCDLESAARELDGAIVGARIAAGRWNNKQSLEFKQPGDRVRVQIPGEFSSLSFSCWVKIDSLDRWYNSLFLTDNYNQGEPHWQILDSGQLFFSVRSKPDAQTPEKTLKGPAHHVVLSPPFWRPSLSGRWLHLATVYNIDESNVTHFLNGQLLHREQIPSAQLARTTRIGAASIGNWSLPTRPDSHFAIRNLNGSMDEFAIYATALSEAEVKEIYEHGKP